MGTNDLFGHEGEICMVTGSAGGMGRATYELLAKLGAEAFGLDRNELDIPGMKAEFAQMPATRRTSTGKTAPSAAWRPPMR